MTTRTADCENIVPILCTGFTLTSRFHSSERELSPESNVSLSRSRLAYTLRHVQLLFPFYNESTFIMKVTRI